MRRSRDRRSASSEVSRIHRRHGAEHVIVMQIADCQNLRPNMQRPNAAVNVIVVNVPHIHASKPAPISTPPRMEPVAGPDRKPAESAPTTKSDTKAPTAAPAPERNVS